ncbi:hypothetical protein N658DRAFT_477586 [Parathielavia hyrcaniae]|uniref:LicD/FKTN/FKRP nucleotidyltransferase domain-containing protein n=1 Tax=Parathielavia hyrcaniae TaxID=113614 RepID=A0AAN6PV08_9PEZI|nr:hypothetical protein N658DRAFT_477586 [Parathielavia hyrcaniae]
MILSPSLFFTQKKCLLLVTALLVFSAILGTAAVARAGAPPPATISSSSSSSSPSPIPSEPPAHDGQNKTDPPPAEPEEYKYFQEAGGGAELTHYDARFFRGKVPYATHRAVLAHLIRSYTTTFRTSLRLETWLAHGTLLGWWWNGRIMPWDFDVDAQVSGETLRVMAARHNGSLHEYTYRNETTGLDEIRVFLLDVNAFGTRVGRGTGANAIDARWIDVETGMYVDITALMERDRGGKPGVVSCKNFHDYTPAAIWPLRETKFEGVTALVPREFEKVLVDEYGAKSLEVTEWEGHHWDAKLKEWIKNETTNENKTEGVL